MTIEKAAVLGAGTMGHGIAHILAMAGVRTVLVDIDVKVAEKGLKNIEKNLDKGVARGKVSAEEKEKTLSLLSISTEMSSVDDVDLFIEAVPEKMELKKKVLKDASERAKTTALIASNTSSLSISEMAAATTKPENIIGLHFFNPVHIMKLLEIVKGVRTSDESIQRARELAKRLRKNAILVDDAPGFASSRLGITLGNEAMRMVQEGVASPTDIDAAMNLGYGHPMGPLALTDLVGLDVRMHISRSLFEELGTDGFRPPRIMKKLVAAGDVGRKVGRGFYIWEDGKIVGENPLLSR
ncbi:MAG: 3-hydroxyacyl-CoA dehydrogenase family protein [Deltaproteobacteria bacterium]|nr:3-hydroxyacyl-CoA dehydrogenase family protein [Deltaproteobacteria bacterium]